MPGEDEKDVEDSMMWTFGAVLKDSSCSGEAWMTLSGPKEDPSGTERDTEPVSIDGDLWHDIIKGEPGPYGPTPIIC